MIVCERKVRRGRVTRLRKLCRSKKGYLLGGQVLYVLRPRGSFTNAPKHEYIGECYVHGLMDGEVVKWVKEGSAGIVPFILA